MTEALKERVRITISREEIGALARFQWLGMDITTIYRDKDIFIPAVADMSKPPRHVT